MYVFEEVKKALEFNTVEILPTNSASLDEEIKILVESANSSGKKIHHYIGFEISGLIHIGTGIMTALKIKKLQEAGIKCSIFLANYHTWLNEKLDGKMETILSVKKDYFEPVFKQCCKVVGCDVDDIDFIGAEILYRSVDQNNVSFWDYMMKVSKNLTLGRVNKSVTITGKQAGEGVGFGVLCYPVMQVADAFFMNTHIVHAGIDQRKCHVLMREVASGMDEGYSIHLGDTSMKPICVHHPLLLSLGISAKNTQQRMNADLAEELKMSKSKPDSALWVHDSPEEISRKLAKAYCPMVNTGDDMAQVSETQAFNPILNWLKFMVFPAGLELTLHRLEEHGGLKNYSFYDDLERDYFAGEIHPVDLKTGISKVLSDWFQPIRDWVIADENASRTLDYLTQLKKSN